MRAVWIVSAILISITSQSQAATYRVSPDGLGHFPSIQSAIDICAPGDTVLCASGTYMGAGNQELNFQGVDLVLRSEGGSQSCVLMGGDDPWSNHCFWFVNGESRSAIVEGFTITSFYTSFSGSAIFCSESSSPTFKDLVITGNSAYQFGAKAVVYSEDSSPRFENVEVFDNWSDASPSGMLLKGSSQPELIGVHFYENAWGALAVIGGAAPTFSDVLIENEYYAVSASSGSPLTLSGLTLMHNAGHALAYFGPELVLRDCLFHDTKGPDISVGCQFDGILNLSGCTFSSNRAASIGLGGSIYACSADSLFVDRCVFAHADSIAIDWPEDTGMRIQCSDFYGNAGGNVSPAYPDPVGLNGNLGLNPLICGAINDPEFLFALSAGSPCLPENNDCGVHMGNLELGCPAPTDADSVELPDIGLRCHPNPFNPSTELSFVLIEPAAVNLAIYDLAGRRVARLMDEVHREAGRHTVAWDGLGVGGRQMPSGVYFARLTAGTHRYQARLVLLK